MKEQYDDVNDFEMSRLDDGKSVMITKYLGLNRFVRIPPEILGLRVTSIGKGAFSGCHSLANINIPNSVTSIGEGAFSGCDSLASVTIPDSVTSIGEDAFSECDSLASVTFEGMFPSSGCSDSAFPRDLYEKYLAGGKGTYTISYSWTKQP
jgi:hypothetical protein